MTSSRYNVLFLCTGNSARSIMAEALLRQHGAARFEAFSAGSHPAGAVAPMALELLRALHLPSEGLRSKSWSEFAAPGAPAMDFVFTLCRDLACEPCPAWPGQPITAHWAVDDPVAVTGNEIERRQAFRETLRGLENRIKIFCSLRLDSLGLAAIKQQVEEIGLSGSREQNLSIGSGDAPSARPSS